MLSRPCRRVPGRISSPASSRAPYRPRLWIWSRRLTSREPTKVPRTSNRKVARRSPTRGITLRRSQRCRESTRRLPHLMSYKALARCAEADGRTVQRKCIATSRCKPPLRASPSRGPRGNRSAPEEPIRTDEKAHAIYSSFTDKRLATTRGPIAHRMRSTKTPRLGRLCSDRSPASASEATSHTPLLDAVPGHFQSHSVVGLSKPVRVLSASQEPSLRARVAFILMIERSC